MSPRDGFDQRHAAPGLGGAMRLAALAALLHAWPALGAQVRQGDVALSIAEGHVACRFGDALLFTVAPLEAGGGDGAAGVPWTLVDHADTRSGHVLELRAAHGGAAAAALSVRVDGGTCRLTWHGEGGRGRVHLRIPDATYRDERNFRYQATFRDGRVLEATVQFDAQHPGPTRHDLSVLTLSAPRNDVTFAPTPGQGAWDFVDTRRFGPDAGADDLALTSAFEETGEPWQRGLHVTFSGGERFEPLNLRAVVNQGFMDEEDDDGKGGWTDQGSNDLRHFPPGPRHLLGVPFDIIDPSTNDGRSAMVLQGRPRMHFPRRAQARVDRRFRSLHVLHTAAWARPGPDAARYHLQYADGGRATIAVKPGRDLLDWWGGTAFAAEVSRGEPRRFEIAWLGRSGDDRNDVRVFASSYANPHPDKLVESIVFESTGSEGVPIVIAVTTATGDYRARGRALKPVGDRLPIAPIRFVHTRGGQIKDWIIEHLKIGLPLVVDEGLEHLTDETDFVCIDGAVDEAHVAALVAYVYAGGTAWVVAKLGSNERLAALLPYDPVAATIVSTPLKWGLLTPLDDRGPLFAGLPWDSDVYDYPVPPVMKCVDVGPLAAGAQVLATWNRDGPPALVSHDVGRGRVIVWTPAHSMMLEPDIKRRLSGFIDYFAIKLYCWLARHEADAHRVGRMAAARIARNRIGLAYATCRATLEDLGSAAQFLGAEAIDRRLGAIDDALVKVDAWTDRLDRNLLALDPDADTRAGYRAVVAELSGRAAEMSQLGGDLAQQATARADVTGQRLRTGRPLRTGVFLTLMDQHENTINGEYKLRHYLSRVRDLEFDATMLYVTAFRYGAGGYGIGERAHGFLWEWRPGREGREIAYRFDQGPLDWFMDVLEDHGNNFIVQLSYSRPPNWRDHRWLDYVKRCVAHFQGRDVVLAFEPNNEGLVHLNSTDADFRVHLVSRYADVAGINAAMGTSFKALDQIAKPKMVSMGGKKEGPEAAMKTAFGSPERALYYEYMCFEMDWHEAWFRRTYEAVKSATSKPMNSRDSPIQERLHGGPLRMERRARWHDSLGTHVQVPYDLDRTRGLSGGKPLWLTEYYWWQWGGDWAGHRYRLHGSLMLPIADVERRNLAANSRNFWLAVSRGTELFAYYSAYPYLGRGLWERGYGGTSSTVWPDYSIKRPLYAAVTQRHVYDRFAGEIQGSHTESRVALMEPVASRLQLEGSPLKHTTGSIRHEIRKMWGFLKAARIQSDPVAPNADLTAYRYVLLPSGLCLADATTRKLLAWVEAGGTLIATLAPGAYDGYTRPHGRILARLQVAARQRPVGTYHVHLPDEQFELRPSAVYAYEPREGFDGRVIATYADGDPAWVAADLGAGHVHLIGWSAHRSFDLLAGHVIPRAIDRSAIADWSLQADGELETFVRHKENFRVFFIANARIDRPASATLTFTTPHHVVDLRSGLLAKRDTLPMPRLLPGACRVFKVFD